MKETEIEVQAKVEHVAPLLSLLEREGQFQSEKRQVDEYFSPAHRDFLAAHPVEEWLRVRRSDHGCSLNYKKWHIDKEGRGLYADEYKTKIEDADMARKVITSLDAKSIVTVEKMRKTWLYRDYEINLDSVKGLGDFVEVEYMGKRDPSEHREIMEEMVKFLKDLGCGRLEVNHSGYPALLLNRGERVDVL